MRLFRLVESPRYAQFDYAPDYAIAELTLARALIRAGGYKTAERYLLRVLGRGPKSPAFAPAYRALVDVALETREQAGDPGRARSLRRRTSRRAAAARCPRTAQTEHTYLAGKVAYESGRHRRAPRRCSPSVDRQSRFYAAALYFRGLIHARAGHLASARRIAVRDRRAGRPETASRSSSTGATTAIKDLAYLALGRIAHEQEKYDDAYYFYFRVPEDSERLPDALFEASWSMFQKGEYEAANAFLEEFDRSFGKTPLAPDVMLLHAMIDLKSCQFDDVRATLDKLVKTYAPLQAQVATLLKDPDKRVRASTAACSASRSIGTPRDPIIELLKIDPRFYKFYADIVALDREAGLIPGEVAVWDELTAHEKGSPGRRTRPRRCGWCNDVEALRPLAAGDPEMESRVADLADQARRAARLINVARRAVRRRRRRPTLALAGEARKLRAQLVAATSTIAEQGAGRSRQAAARAAAPGAPHPHRRGHRQEEEARDRDREPAPGPLSRPTCSRRCSSRA